MYACVRACMRERVRVFVREYLHACVCARVVCGWVGVGVG